MEYYSVFSWGLVIFVAGSAIYVYRPDLVERLLPATPAVSKQPAAALGLTSKSKKSKKSKASDEINGSDVTGAQSKEDSRSSKKRKITAPINKTVTATAIDGQKKELPRDTTGDADDKAFAEQLKKAQAGTKLQSRSHQKGNLAPRSAAGVQPRQSEEELSSTTGQDADDDLSSVDSARRQASSSSGKDVSDMLESKAAGPNTLRLTNVSEPKKQKQAPQKFEEVQSKKKRNEQARREEQKRVNQESERLHEQKKQDQLRQARMAEGTSNQSKANAFGANTQNAWQNKAKAAMHGKNTSAATPLLDTFEASSKTKSSVQTQPAANLSNQPRATGNATALKAEQGEGAVQALAASGRESGVNKALSDLSEEEQIQRLREQEQDDAWESVQNKKSKRKTRQGAETSSDASPPDTREASQNRIPPPARMNGNNKVDGAVEQHPSVNRFAAVQPVDMGGLEEDEWQA